jgi:hypothetical protein
MLTAERVREVLNYDPDTGIFTWKIHRHSRRKPGDVAARYEPGKRKYICIDNRDYLAHRLAWLHVHGEWPNCLVDHVNGDPGDNRLANLRLATYAQNLSNSRVKKSNKLGLKGVQEYRSSGRYVARITVDKKIMHLGSFASPSEAHAAYVSAARNYRGEFACDGKRE